MPDKLTAWPKRRIIHTLRAELITADRRVARDRDSTWSPDYRAGYRAALADLIRLLDASQAPTQEAQQ